MKRLTTVIFVILMVNLALAAGGKDEEVGPAMMMMEASPTEMEKGNSQERDNMSTIQDFTGMDSAMVMAGQSPTVLFFNASWCPSCRAAKNDLEANLDKLTGVNVILVDYDRSEEMKRKYGVTYQHTFVYIDGDGMALDIWNGGGAQEILDHIHM